MPVILSGPTVERWFLDVYCTDLHRASGTSGKGCERKIRFFACDVKYKFLGSGMDNAGDVYPYVNCPNCQKVLLLHDREIPSHVAVAIKKGSVPQPDPEITVDSTHTWEIAITCGGNRKTHPSDRCGNTYTVKAADVICGIFGADYRGADGTVKYYSKCPHCGHNNILMVPPFVEEEARIRREIASRPRR